MYHIVDYMLPLYHHYIPDICTYTYIDNNPLYHITITSPLYHIIDYTYHHHITITSPLYSIYIYIRVHPLVN